MKADEEAGNNGRESSERDRERDGIFSRRKTDDRRTIKRETETRDAPDGPRCSPRRKVTYILQNPKQGFAQHKKGGPSWVEPLGLGWDGLLLMTT